MNRLGDHVKVIYEHTTQTKHLLYIDPTATRHAMCWVDDEFWRTACGILLSGRGRISHPHHDLRDIVMGIPTCMMCIATENGEKIMET